MGTYGVSTDWKLMVDTSRRSATDANGGLISIPPIEPDVLFTFNTIGIYVSSATARPTWYRAGNLYQSQFVPFGSAGYAEADAFPAILNRYQIHRFTQLPDIEVSYLISFTPQFYISDIRLQLWQYIGTNQGATLDNILTATQQGIQQTKKAQTSLNQLLKRVKA
ncbi:hypothetical protein [Nostoc sp. 'Peltigera membranacea cyanobiont' 232]|uniref:hypothetical protein n=1 Tax=Nostoc sp. 'Peltigera membranacea cyanobiont' 232 TaxID=2014531 RepID=UPI000B954A5D|nr:hypothetical protein [Nostoc sp. 'Peltigera membranacea cyanobiont' 232]OYE02141.1 hypothetical protein CDG79_25570 [Nostoc sp. 'Peltigera membranacea cyanobiont' 232]